VSALRLAEALGLSAKAVGQATEDTESTDERSSGATAVREAIGRLNSAYQETGRSFRIELVAGGYRVMTLPRFAKAIAAFQGGRSRTTLSHAALETLAIISYKQPITRARLEAIRGVACGEILRSLIDRRLVTVAGRAEELGRPILYATTKRFLETFGLSSLKDLPTMEELRPQV
jgi:segregation and condensation protein B